MKPFFYITILAIASCTPDYHVDIPDKGDWVRLVDDNNQEGYCFFNNKVYGVELSISDTTGLYQFMTDLQPLPILQNADAATFEVCINSDFEPYAKDAFNVYYHSPSGTIYFDGEVVSGEIYYNIFVINGADPLTFKYMGDGYAADKNNMYFRGVKIDWNDRIVESLRTKLKAEL